MLAGRAVGGCLVAGIAAPAIAAAQEDDVLARLGKVGKHVLPVFRQYLRADGHLDDKVFSAGARAVGAGAVVAALRLEVLRVTKVDKRVQPFNGFKHDVATLAAIAAIRPAIFDEFFAPKTDRANAARPRFDIDFCLVKEMHGQGLWR